MESVSQKIDELRQKYPVLQEDRIPIDIFTFFEIELRLNPIPLPDLTLKYGAEAAISLDFKSIYVDAEQYELMEDGPVWKLNRLRFTIAHELAHYFLHRDIPQKNDFMAPAGPTGAAVDGHGAGTAHPDPAGIAIGQPRLQVTLHPGDHVEHGLIRAPGNPVGHIVPAGAAAPDRDLQLGI